MSDIINAIILGIVQGLTEFLPVSSSGHLEIAKTLLGADLDEDKFGMLMTVVLHFATALSTVVVFRKDIVEILKGVIRPSEDREHQWFCVKILISMIPAVIVGLAFEEQIEALFTGNMLLVGSMLLLTGVLSAAGRPSKDDRKTCEPSQCADRWNFSSHCDSAGYLSFGRDDFNLCIAGNRPREGGQVFVLDGRAVDLWKNGQRLVEVFGPRSGTSERLIGIRGQRSSEYGKPRLCFVSRWIRCRVYHRLAGLRMDDSFGEGLPADLLRGLLLHRRRNRDRQCSLGLRISRFGSAGLLTRCSENGINSTLWFRLSLTLDPKDRRLRLQTDCRDTDHDRAARATRNNRSKRERTKGPTIRTVLRGLVRDRAPIQGAVRSGQAPCVPVSWQQPPIEPALLWKARREIPSIRDGSIRRRQSIIRLRLQRFPAVNTVMPKSTLQHAKNDFEMEKIYRSQTRSPIFGSFE